MNHLVARYRLVLVLLLGSALPIMPAAAQDNDARDPFERYNRTMFEFNRELDKAVLKPVAETYRKITPDVVETGVSNFFGNLRDVFVAVNSLLQFKFEQAAQDTGRFVFNSTFGLFGLIDIATPMGLPRNNEDFGQTLGYWGVGEGYYLILPVFGSSTTRDVWSFGVDYYLLHPLSYVDPTGSRLLLRGVEIIDFRAGLLGSETLLEEAALDPYTFQRDAYLQRRRNLVYDGNPPKPDFDFDFEDTEPVEPPAEP